jgi:predicted P-loop ATPase
MKKINLEQLLVDPNGKVATSSVKRPSEITKENGEVVEVEKLLKLPVSLGVALIDSVLKTMEILSQEEKMVRYRLFQKLNNVSEIELTDEEINNLKQYVCDRYEVNFFGQIIDMLSE